LSSDVARSHQAGRNIDAGSPVFGFGIPASIHGSVATGGGIAID
jgi:hypothetical protein